MNVYFVWFGHVIGRCQKRRDSLPGKGVTIFKLS